MNLRIIERRLRRDHNLPSDFHFSLWSMQPEFGDPIYVEISGCQCPLKTRGKYKGNPDFSKGTNRRSFAVKVEDAERWEDEYEAETGNCRRCLGEGKTVGRIDFVNKVTTHRDCCACGGSGKARLLVTTHPTNESEEP